MQASKADFPIDFKFESFSKVIIERDWQSLNALSPINSAFEIPASVTIIGSGAFHGCSSLEQVSFEKGSQLMTIKDGCKDGSNAAYGAFTNCDNLTLFDASNCTQIRAIGNYAFNYSSRWQSEISFTIKLGTEIPPTLTYNKDEYWNSTFDFSNGNSEYLNLIVPAGCVDAYKNAETWKKFKSISELDE